MTLTTLLLWLYGQVLVGGAVTALVWGRLFWRRWRGIARQSLGDDAYFWISGGIAAVLTGVVIGTFSRVATAFLTGDSAASSVPWGLVTSLSLLSFGSGALVWGSTIDRTPTPWRAFVALSLAWFCIVALWRF